MSYTRIRELPQGGREVGHSVDVNNDQLVLEQDITRQITPLSFLSNSIAQLDKYTNSWSSIPPKETATNVGIAFSDFGAANTTNLTVKTLMDYINHNLNVVNQVYYVNSGGEDTNDCAERGRNIQLPFKTINYAAKVISDAIAGDYYNQNDPNLVPDPITTPLRKQYTIMVSSGDYTEYNPIYLPPNTSLIGDNLRRTTIRPQNPYLDLFWVDSANYIWGFTFRDLKEPASAVAYPISTVIAYPDGGGAEKKLKYAASDFKGKRKSWVRDSYDNAYKGTSGGNGINTIVIPSKRPYIYVSPYIQGCTSYNISSRMPKPGPNKSVLDEENNVLLPSTWTSEGGTYGDLAPDPITGAPGVRPPDDAGCGLRIDGQLVQGYFRSMVLDSFTQVNQGGKGVYILNHGYAQLVSIFTIATSQGVVCEDGGTCSISTSNSTFGLSGLVATGKSYSPVLQGNFVIPNEGKFTLPSTDAFPYGYTTGGNLFTINNVSPLPVKYDGDDVTDTEIPMYVAANPYATLCFTVGDDKPWDTGNGMSGPGYLMETHISPLINRKDSNDQPIYQVKLFYIEQGAPVPSLSGGKPDINKFGNNNLDYKYYHDRNLSIPNAPENPTSPLPWDIQLSYNLGLDLTKVIPFSGFDANDNKINFNDGVAITYYSDALGTIPITNQNDYIRHLINQNGVNSNLDATINFTNAPVKFYARSVIETGSHTFEYMGTGTRMKYAIPAFGGVTNNSNEAISDGQNDAYGNKPGIVFFTSSNELGNFKVGTDFTIVQSTGTIQGETFNRAILTLVTPLTIVLE
jgi:hypothetical protein